MHAVAFGGVVTGGKEMQAVLAGEVHRLLGGFAGQKGIDARVQREFDIGFYKFSRYIILK